MKQIQLVIDRASIGLSCLCVVHCLLLPILLVLFPTFSSLAIADESFHQVLVLAVLPSSIVALALGYRAHGQVAVLGWGGIGLVLLTLTALFGHDWLGESGEKSFTVVASLLISFSHVRNFVLAKQHQA